MEKEKYQQTSGSGITTNLTVENYSIIQLESGSSQVINDDSATNQLITTTANKEKNDRKKTIYKIMIFISLQIALFLSALDNTIVSTLLPHVGSEFNQMAIASWVSTAYILTIITFQPLFAKFSDIFGRKWTLISGISIFLFGSLLCGISTSMIMLITSRAVAGIGAAGITSCVYIIINEIIPLEKRGSFQGIIDGVFVIASIFGPLGSFTDNISWRWCFYINLPIGGAAILLLLFFLELPTEKSSLIDQLKQIDYIGTLLILISGLLFLLALNFGSYLYPWTSAAVLVPLIFSFIFIILFIFVESKIAKEPIVPLRLFKNRSVTGILNANWWFSVSFLSMVYYIPIYSQVVKGDSAILSGIRLVPMELAIFTGSFSTGLLITKLQIYRPFIWLGSCLVTLGTGLIPFFDVDTDFSLVYGIIMIGGAGMGLLYASLAVAMQASIEPKDIAVVTGLGNFSRLLGCAIGVAIAGSVLNSELETNLSSVLPPEYVEMVIKQPLFVWDGLPEQYKSTTIQAYCDSFRFIWYCLTPITGLSIVGAFLIKHYSLRNPGQQNKNNNNQNHQHHRQSIINNDNSSDEGTEVEYQRSEEKKKLY